MIQVMFSVKDGGHTRGEVLELEDLGPEDLARVDDLILEMKGHLERIARVRAAKARTREG